MSLQIFDVMSGKLVQSLAGHAEEVLCIKLLRFEGKQYLVSASQDGTIIKWCLSDDFRYLLQHHYTALTCSQDTGGEDLDRGPRHSNCYLH